MEWPKFWTVQVISVLGGISGILGLLALWESPVRTPLIITVAALCAIFFIVEHQKDRVTVLFSGVKRYYSSFNVNENAEVFAQVRDSYRYFGISFDSVKTAFGSWYSQSRPGSPTIQILLADPEVKDDEILKFQARYEIDALTDPLTPEQAERVQRIVARTKSNIYSTLATLAALPGADCIEIKFHKDRARRWTHEVDGKLLYLGLLKRGNSGMNSPVLLLNKSRENWTLFNHHHDGWEGLWQAGRHVSLTTYKGATHAAGS